MAANTEWSRLLTAPALPGLELVHARYDGHEFPLHAHAEFAISVVNRGVKTSRRGRKRFVAEPGLAGLFNPYEEHATAPLAGGWTCTAIYMTPALVGRWFGSSAIRFDRPMVDDLAGVSLVGRLHRTLARRDSALRSEIAFVEMLSHFLARYGKGGASGGARYDAGAARARKRLDEDDRPDLGLADLAREAGVTPVRLLREFRQAFGCTPYAYSTARRLAAAKQALALGDTIADVAVRHGFCDQSHFTRVLRRWTGITPGAFAEATHNS